MEFVSFVVFTLTTVLTCAETSEVFTGFWNIFKKLKNYTLFDIVLLAFISDCKIEENLRVFRIKFWKSCFFITNFWSGLFVVYSLREKFLHRSLLALSL